MVFVYGSDKWVIVALLSGSLTLSGGKVVLTEVKEGEVLVENTIHGSG